MPLDFNEIRQLLETIAKTDITEVTLKSDNFEITVRKNINTTSGVSSTNVVSSGVSTGSELPLVMPTPPIASSATSDATASRTVDTPANTDVQSPATPSPLEQKKFTAVTSPMVGTFYRSPAPGEATFVEVGDRIRSGQTVCIIEAMKLMNEIEAEVSGQVIEILVQNGEPVEYGQPLMRINPD
ncbi:MAG: acetyl-CoA carboxylase biotin carboxyl carrier protein [Pelatocladus maniniholoensis HA4357-MV3]|uniref:Biotin carboxyl carrier protein of acetyl-CoA carboxylase n=1 Tax=Pelatocladus maniniholoensis HA4357-MV3 TaxID=1117104 RepID=A0A9E3LSI9_9NOST|nr:acetyl-CoA carboxylase biotin carboxyl carrier protein [Pelatocladus maniniholoensis HA4357-MV3]BAZ65673.1 acetyl-CoA carboxylase biotin carboxyl carrier protein [Fischerella sp. NIES-4106]